MVVKKTALHEDVSVQVGNASLNGILHIPLDAKAVVIFAHGSGSSRLSQRNQLVASFLHDVSIATLLFDLLTSEEEERDQRTSSLRFNIPFLAERLISVTEWVFQAPDTHHLTTGYFGASTGASAALIAAAELPEKIGAVVSRGGRPDLAGQALSKVKCPTLFIVGGNDFGVIEINQHALDLLGAPQKKIEIIPEATHLFEEPGALEEVSRMASLWFSNYL